MIKARRASFPRVAEPGDGITGAMLLLLLLLLNSWSVNEERKWIKRVFDRRRFEKLRTVFSMRRCLKRSFGDDAWLGPVGAARATFYFWCGLACVKL